MLNQDKKVIIVGAGVSAAFSAKRLVELGYRPENITVLEAKHKVGGKLDYYKDPKHPGLGTEKGAVVLTSNYPMDVFKENGLKFEKLLPTDKKTVDIAEHYNHLSALGKIKFANDFRQEMVKFNHYVDEYNQALLHSDGKPPKDFELPFAEFADKYNLPLIKMFMEPYGPGFCYGLLDDPNCYTYRMLTYMRHLTIPTIALGNFLRDGLICVQGGYEQIVEKMLANYDVETSVNINQIDRSNAGVTVNYTQNNENKTKAADLLLITTSPLQWSKLGMQLSDAEKTCVDTLKYYQYPVAVCHIKGLAPNQRYDRVGLQRAGLNHVAFLSTRDNRKNPEDGRLCTVYVNVPEGPNNYSLDEGRPERAALIADLMKLPNVTDVKVDEWIKWDDYNATSSYAAGHALKLEEKAHKNCTMHPASFRNESFESVAGASRGAGIIVDNYHNQPTHKFDHFGKSLSRAIKFFTVPLAPAYDDSKEETQRSKIELR